MLNRHKYEETRIEHDRFSRVRNGKSAMSAKINFSPAFLLFSKRERRK